MRRRGFITLIGAATAWPAAARGQKASKLPNIGFSERDGATQYTLLQGASAMTYTVGSYLAKRLEQIGLKHHFAVAGDGEMVL